MAEVLKDDVFKNLYTTMNEKNFDLFFKERVNFKETLLTQTKKTDFYFLDLTELDKLWNLW